MSQLAKDLGASVREFTEKLRAQVAAGDVQGANDSLTQLSAAADVAVDDDAEKAKTKPAPASSATSAAPSPSDSPSAASTSPATSVPSTASKTAPPTPASVSKVEPAVELTKVAPSVVPVAPSLTPVAGVPPPAMVAPPAAPIDPIASLAGDDAVNTLFGKSIPTGPMSKAIDPGIMATPPPMPRSPMLVYAPRGQQSYVDEMAPALYKALAQGGMYCLDNAIDLFKSSNGRHDTRLFDLTLHKVYRTLLDAGGFNEGNDQLFHKMAITVREAEELGDRDFVNVLQKGVTSTTAPGYYLHQMVKIMLPVLTPLLNRFATQKPRTGGKQAEWRANLGFANLDETQGMLAPEAGVTVGSTTGIGQNINENPVLFQTPYSRHPVNDAVTVEAQYAMLGYDDAFQYAMVRALTAYMRIAEMATLWNNRQAISNSASVTVTGAGSGSLGNTNDKFAVTALTGIGWRLNQLTLGGKGGASSVVGESAAILSSATDLSAKATCVVAWPAVPGAVAYNLYYVPAGVAASAIYVGIYTRNKVTITAKPTGAVNLYPTIDGTANSVGYEGVVPWSELSTIYGNALSNKTVTDQAGAALTLSGPNRISEIDTILSNLLRDWQLAPSLIIGSPNMIRHVNNMIQSGGAAQPYIIHLGGGAEQGSIVGGLWAGAYTNNYSLGLQNVPKLIDLMAHPYLADGTLLVLTETIPYPMAREARGWLIEQQIPLTYWPLASLTASWPFMIFSDQVLESFHPPAQSAIQGVDDR